MNFESVDQQRVNKRTELKNMEERERTNEPKTFQNSSNRIEELAKPKPLPAGFLDDKRSVYWDNNLEKDWTKSPIETTQCALSERQTDLAKNKAIHKSYVGDRPSSIWQVSPAAQNATASSRTETLAESKSLHRDYQPCKQVQSVVSDAAMSAEATDKLEQLAKPKTFAPLKIKDESDWDWSEWQPDLTEAAKKATASERVVVLANPKNPHRNYKEGRPVIWEVPESAKKALPSLRIQQLARPKSRSKYSEDYDGNAWRVSPGAKNAQATPRIAQLAAPLERKVRAKKVV